MASLDEFPLVPTDTEIRSTTSTDGCIRKLALFSTNWLAQRPCVATARNSTPPLSAQRVVDGTPVVAHASWVGSCVSASLAA